MNKKLPAVLILGHSGFIGGSLYQSLKTQGLYDVIGASTKECNLLDLESVKKFFSTLPDDIQIVFCSVINAHLCKSIEFLHDNITIIDNFIKGIQNKKISNLIYLSAVDIYGKSIQLPINESTIINPKGYYGLGKFCGEILLTRSDILNCPITILRLPGVYGPNDKGRSIIGNFASKIIKGEPITLHGDGSTLRDYIEINDVCDIIKSFLNKPQKTILNLAVGESLSIKKMIELISKISNIKPIIEYKPVDLNAAGDMVFDIKKFRKIFPGFKLTNLEQGCAKYIQNFK
ncbi:MAG: NAD(P)-dependent oxidoreductase [Desulfobacterales bacterium]|nr:NAD(P)-dependent oxidoreductase [Desulfobacterales bacterium]